ncbi:hypothetical protein TWF694_005474 [Orbilia ellipsospora]|uniref:Clr5 domain-containing protein n=1 Tax=Orbilia ellipsospora TaxID=2528407 RepID=A0AAV9WUF5_9PEZI
MSDGVFQFWSHARPTRSYLKIEDMEQYKEFILGKRQAGMKHKDILEALKADRSVTLSMHRLKRVLDKWEESRKSLTKRRMLLVRRGIEERRARGKQRHKVILNRPGRAVTRKGRQITQEEMDEIMRVSPSFFKDVKLNLKQAVAVFSTPTLGSALGSPTDIDTERTILNDPSSESRVPLGWRSDGADGNNMDDDEVPDRNFNDYPLNFPPVIQYLPWDEGEGTRRVGRRISDPDHLADAFIRLGMETKDTVVAADEDGHFESENDVKDIQKIIEDGLSQIQETKESKGSGEEESEREEHDGCDCRAGVNHKTLLDKYACQNRHHIWLQIDKWKAEAREFLGAVERVSEEYGVSLQKATDIVSPAWEDQKREEPLPYHIYMQILGEDEASVGSRNGIDGVDSALLCSILEDNFVMMEKVIDRSSSRNSIKIDCDYLAVHFPFALQRFGLNHFFTAFTLDAAGGLLIGTLGATETATQTMNAAALCVYCSIGMTTHSLTLDYFTADLDLLEPELATAYNKAGAEIRKAVLQKYGVNHSKTLLVYTMWATNMVHSSSPHLKKRGELILYGVLQISKAQYLSYSDAKKMYTSRFVREMGGALLRLGRSDLAADFLVIPSSWGRDDAINPTFNCTHVLGVAYANLGKHKESLRTLFSCFNGYRDRYNIDHFYSEIQIERIIEVMNQRGPVLYNCLDSAFDKLFRSLGTGKVKRRTYQILYDARKRSGVDPKEYVDILASISRNKSAISDMGLFMYSQSLETWLNHQEVSYEINQGGWVEEAKDIEVVRDLWTN